LFLSQVFPKITEIIQKESIAVIPKSLTLNKMFNFKATAILFDLYLYLMALRTFLLSSLNIVIFVTLVTQKLLLAFQLYIVALKAKALVLPHIIPCFIVNNDVFMLSLLIT